MTSTYRNPYHQILSKKREWEPIKPDSANPLPGTEDVLRRVLSLRILELPVGQLVQTASSREILGISKFNPQYEDCSELLASNIHDEEVHDEALNNLNRAIGLSTDEETDKQAQSILDAWLELDEHEISKARIIESGCFFPILIWLRYLGGLSARQVAQDISGDEIHHVSTNWLICENLNIEKQSRANTRLRRQSVAWMFEPLNSLDPAVKLSLPENRRKYLDFDFWMQQSDNLAQRGATDGLSETRNTRFVAPFETDKRNQGLYKPQVYR